MMSFFGTLLNGLLLNGFVQSAEAVDWPELSSPVHQAVEKSPDRAIIIALEEYESLVGVRNASVNSDDWVKYFTWRDR